MKVAQAYGMIQPGASDTQAVRATFVIDPEGVLRDVIVPPPATAEAAEARMSEGFETKEWYFSTRPL